MGIIVCQVLDFNKNSYDTIMNESFHLSLSVISDITGYQGSFTQRLTRGDVDFCRNYHNLEVAV